MINYIKLIRVKHWFKNFIVFIPLLFSKNLFLFDKFMISVLGFFIFCISSSVVYVINDLRDMESDKKHKLKKNRPLASGDISPKSAFGVVIVLIILLLGLISYGYYQTESILIILLPLIYIMLNLLYSFGLKNKPIIDVVILVSGFLLRIIYGAQIIDVELSKWLYLMVIFGSFYLGFGKRRNEIIKEGKHSRKVLQYYNQDFLDKNMYVCLGLAIVTYSLWCVDPITITKLSSSLLLWSVPVVVVIFQMYSLDIEGNSYGDPIEVVFADKKLLVTILAYSLFMFYVLYVA